MTPAEEIEHLYARITALPRDRSTVGESNEEVERAFARLRELQQAEAEQYRDQFEAGLKMPIDAGDRILARAYALRKELEDLLAQDTTLQQSADPRG